MTRSYKYNKKLSSTCSSTCSSTYSFTHSLNYSFNDIDSICLKNKKRMRLEKKEMQQKRIETQLKKSQDRYIRNMSKYIRSINEQDNLSFSSTFGSTLTYNEFFIRNKKVKEETIEDKLRCLYISDTKDIKDINDIKDSIETKDYIEDINRDYSKEEYLSMLDDEYEPLLPDEFSVERQEQDENSYYNQLIKRLQVLYPYKE